MITSLNSGYGYFIDEVYYIACAKRLAFGYVDHPPLSILLLWLNRGLLGDTLPALRFLPALSTAATVMMSGLQVRRLNGSYAAMMLAMLACMAMPIYLLMGSFYSMNAFEPLIWSVILYLVIKIVQEQQAKYWLLIGLLIGLGLEMKHTMIVYCIALLIGMLLTETRKLLWNKWFGWGMGCALLLILPNLLWQLVNGFPSLEFYHNAMVNKNVHTPPLQVIVQQILFVNPFTFPLWLAGLLYLILAKQVRVYRFLAWTFLVLLFFLILSASSRPDRIAAMYVPLFVAGALAVDQVKRLSLRPLLIVSCAVLLLLGGALVAPVVTPLLSPKATKQYLSNLGLSITLESGKQDEPLPQWLADRLGWEELAADVASVFYTLSQAEQRNAVIISTNYGEAGALELYSPQYGLPAVFATHNSFHTWGPPPDSVRTFLAVYVNKDDLDRLFDSVEEVKVHLCEHCTRPQQRIPIYVARGPRFTISADWPKFKIYD